MAFLPIVQCDTCLDFNPRERWPRALPALAWRGLLLTGFDRREGEAMDLWADGACSWLEAFVACYPELGLAELARVWTALEGSRPDLVQEFRRGFFAEYKLRWSDRLHEVLRALVRTPLEFQNWVDEKKVGARELSPLLALDACAGAGVGAGAGAGGAGPVSGASVGAGSVSGAGTDAVAVAVADADGGANPNQNTNLKIDVSELLRALVRLPLSKSQIVQGLEWAIELHLLGRPLADLLPNDDNAVAYFNKLERWRRPEASAHDEDRRRTVREWAWPAQVEGNWTRTGDQTGLDIKIHTTSPQDFERKLSRLLAIRDAWSNLA